MRARAGDPARNMPQKILAGRAEDPLLTGDLVRVRVDQVVLARDPMIVLTDSSHGSTGKYAVETAVAYDSRCIREPGEVDHDGNKPASFPFRRAPRPVQRSLVQHGLAIGRPGLGFGAAVHLERFAAPARLALTDNPRLAGLGGAGMLTLLASRSQLQNALREGFVIVRPPRSLQVLLSGRLRPFVGARDLALELLRRGLSDMVRAIDLEHNAPVVLEFAGPSARLLSIADRALLCSLAPQVGASAGLFVSDEKTEVYLRDQRRSKAFRALTPDAGAPCDDVLTIDLSTIDPLVLDDTGQVRTIREVEGQPIHQAVLGGDTGASLRDILATATLLKSKRVPTELDFLVACASRQILEVLAQSEALVDLIATGGRLVEPDSRLLDAQLYAPPPEHTSIRTFDGDGLPIEGIGKRIVASPDTLALAVSTGRLGDPRTFKRPVRITIPRSLPTEDVLVVRKPRGKDAEPKVSENPPPVQGSPPWQGARRLEVRNEIALGAEPYAAIVETTQEIGFVLAAIPDTAPALQLVVAECIPAGAISLLASCGILGLQASSETMKKLRSSSFLTVSSPDTWQESVSVEASNESHNLLCRARPAELSWVAEGSYCSDLAESGS